MYRLGVTSEFHGEGRPGEGDVVLVVGTGGGGADSVSGSASAGLGSGVSSGSLCSSAMSSLTDDGAESSPEAVADRTWSSSSSPSPGEHTMQLDRDGGGPLYQLSPLLADLPVRTGLSKYYKGKSQSFASLSDVKRLQDLAKKTTRHVGRIKASPSSILHHVHGHCSKTIAKKTTPRSSSDQLLSGAGGRGLLLHRSGKPPACQSKKELWSTYA